MLSLLVNLFDHIGWECDRSVEFNVEDTITFDFQFDADRLLLLTFVVDSSKLGFLLSFDVVLLAQNERTKHFIIKV